jgi:antitoxin HigA-1
MLKVSRQALSNILNEKADISPEMALRISKVFGGTATIWMNLQSSYDLEKAEKKIKQIKLTRYRPGETG